MSELGIAEFGEIRFSAIGTEFSDPYSLTDSTQTIRLSHYYKNIQDIPTNHINTFPNSFDEFRLILFHGKKRFIEESSDDEEPISSPPPPEESFDSSGNPMKMQGGWGKTFWEYTKGLEITNLTGRDRNHPNNYFNRMTDNDATTPVRYLPQYIIQAQAGDILQINSQQKTAGYAHVSIWIWINGWMGGKEVEVDGEHPYYKKTTATYYSFPKYQIPMTTPPGKYAIGFSVSWAGRGVDDEYYRSWRQYSLQVWE